MAVLLSSSWLRYSAPMSDFLSFHFQPFTAKKSRRKFKKRLDDAVYIVITYKTIPYMPE